MQPAFDSAGLLTKAFGDFGDGQFLRADGPRLDSRDRLGRVRAGRHCRRGHAFPDGSLIAFTAATEDATVAPAQY